MAISSPRFDRYVTMAACGSGAVGLAVSPLHGDVYYDDNSVTISLTSNFGSSTSFWASTSQAFSGESVQWGVWGGVWVSQYSSSTYANNDQSAWSGWSRNYYMSQSWGFSNVNFGVASQAQAIDSNFDFNSSGTFAWNFISSYASSFWSSYDGASYSSNWSSSSSTSSGAMALGERAFLGMEFENNSGDTVYGWAEIGLSADGFSFIVHSWAYDDTGGMILAGQTEASTSTPVPGLGGLAALAGGAAGMRRKRNRVA